MSRRYVLAVGRSRVGIRHDGAIADERVHLIVMLIAGDKARDYLQVLATIARQVREPDFVSGLVEATDLDVPVTSGWSSGFGGIRPVQAQQNRINRLMFREAEAVARGAACRAIMVFGDTFIGGIERGRPALEDEDDPGHPQPDRGHRGRGGLCRDDPGAVLLDPAAGPAAQRDPGRPHPQRHRLHRPDLLPGRHDRQQPVRHPDRGRHRAGVPDPADRAVGRPAAART